MEVAAQRLEALLRLPTGWDGHQGRPISPLIADYAFKLLQNLMLRSGLPIPSITPLAHGGIMLEWHQRGWDVEIEIDTWMTDDKRVTFYIDAYSPESIPMAKLADYMADFATLLGRDHAVYFAGLEKGEDGSTNITARVDIEDMPKVEARLNDIRLAEDAIKRLAARDGETVDEWATALSNDLASFHD